MVRLSPGERVVILGAGASRGGSFVKPGYAECLPPLNADFFTQLQRIRTKKHLDLTRSVIVDVVTTFGSNFSLTLEEYFTHLESMLAAAKRSYRTDRALAPKQVEDMRTRLLDALAAVLEESTDVTRRNPRTGVEMPVCDYHGAIVDVLKARDTVITFNYDCVMDHALRKRGEGKWSAQYGYGFPGPSRVEGHEYWSAADPPRGLNATINLLKLHGSVNWFPLPEKGAPSSIRLRRRTYRQNGSSHYEIVPPEFVKRIDEKPALLQIWRYAELAIRKARVLAFIGFSFTPADLHAESTFRLALSGNKVLEKVVIANPNRDHRAKIRSVLATPLRELKVPVVQYDDLAGLAVDVPTALSR